MRFVVVLRDAIRAGELDPAEDVLPDPRDGGPGSIEGWGSRRQQLMSSESSW